MAYIELKEKMARGKKKYKVRVREKSKEAFIKSKTKTFSCERQAKSWGISTKLELEIQHLPPKVINTIENNIAITKHSTIGAIIRYFLTENDKSPKPYSKSYISALKQILEYDITYLHPSQLNWESVRSFCLDRKSNGAGEATIAINISILTTAFKTIGKFHKDIFSHGVTIESLRPLLKNQGYIGKSNVRYRRLVNNEEERIKAQLQIDNSKIDYAALFELYILTCQRRSALLAVKWEDILWDEELIRITTHKKTRRDIQYPPRFIPLTEDIKEILINLKDKATQLKGRVFPVAPGTVTKKFTQAISLAIVDNYVLHDLRTEGASRLMELGLTIKETAGFTGHQDLEVLNKIYGHIKVNKIGDRYKILKAQLKDAQIRNII